MVAKAIRFLSGTPKRTFVVYPATGARVRTPDTATLAPAAVGVGLSPVPAGPRLRQREHAGSFGFSEMPARVLTHGPYRFTRNPMYMGHLIFMLGLALSTGSKFGSAILLANVPWFNARVREDERRLRAKFGNEYDDYCRRVRRWI